MLLGTYFIIYKTGNKKQLSQIYENFGTYVSEKEFMDVYEYATQEPHGFLYIDTDPKEPYIWDSDLDLMNSLNWNKMCENKVYE